MNTSSALDGIRVLDFTHVLQGPLATQLLADFGADVIKIERMGMGDWSRGYGPHARGMSLVFAGLNRNKRSVTVDLRSEAGRGIVERLLEEADVLVHNFRPGAMEKLGLDYDQLRRRFPRLIYAESTGWGDTGPYVQSRRKGHADMAAATGGLFRFSSDDHPPSPPGVTIDYPAGLLLAQAILLALLERERSGEGQRVSTDLLSAAVMAKVWDAGEALNPEISEREDYDLGATEASIPRAWRTRDGFIEISAVFSPDALRDLSLAMGLDDLSQDPRFDTAPKRTRHQKELEGILQNRFLDKTTSEWLACLEAQGVLCSAINTFAEAVRDPQVQANQMVIGLDRPGVGRIRVLGTPIRMSRTPAAVRSPPPFLGEHTEAVLEELGFDAGEIAQLREAGVIG